jgi:hypothetical protein
MSMTIVGRVNGVRVVVARSWRVDRYSGVSYTVVFVLRIGFLLRDYDDAAAHGSSRRLGLHRLRAGAECTYGVTTGGGDWLDDMLDKRLADSTGEFIDVVKIRLMSCTDMIEVIADGANCLIWLGHGHRSARNLLRKASLPAPY